MAGNLTCTKWDGNDWSPATPLKDPGSGDPIRSDSDPALAAHTPTGKSETLYCVYKDTGSNNLCWTSTVDGDNWTSYSNFPHHRTKSVVGLAEYYSQLMCIYARPDDKSTVAYTTGTEKSGQLVWAPEKATGWTNAYAELYLAVFGDQPNQGKPIAAYSDNSLNHWGAYIDPIGNPRWTPSKPMADHQIANGPPALGEFADRLVAVFPGIPDCEMMYATFDGDAWSAPRKACTKSGKSIGRLWRGSLAEWGDALYCTYFTADQLLWATLHVPLNNGNWDWDLAFWTEPAAINSTKPTLDPAVAEHDGDLYCVYGA